jgi:DNA-binding NtrC family response regulator
VKMRVTIETMGKTLVLEDPTLEALSQAYVRAALEIHGDNRTHAAPFMGIHLRSVHRMIERWGGRLRWNRRK